MNEAIELFPFAKRTKESIENQNKFLQKISLTGKINALEFSVNLFEYTDETIKKFEILKNQLIEALVEESLNKVTSELYLKSQLSIDVLKRNLFERIADVKFLSTDSEIINFLQNKDYDKELIKQRLIEYTKKYSIYDDVIIFDTKGHAKVNIHPENILTNTKDSILQEALESDNFIEQYRYSDIFKSKKRAMIYAHKIVSHGSTIGVLCLVFKFNDEMKTIYNTLASENELLTLEDDTGVIATSNNNIIKKFSKLSLRKQDGFMLYNQNKIAIQTKTRGYQGYFGLDWKATAIALKLDKTDTSYKKQIVTPKIQKIINQAHETVEDLGDVIINGELIASKFRQYTLSPILDSLRTISGTLLEDINNSAENLANTATAGLLSDAKIATIFSIDLMDRNLYERANDCRWWALTPEFSKQLAQQNPDRHLLTEILKYINKLYTIYTNIIIYDKSGTVIATSQDETVVGKNLSSSVVNSVLQNRNSQNYFVSPFETTDLYKDRPTYIYHASITHNDITVGGIAVVYDSEPEFEAILVDSSLEGKNGIDLFCDKDKMIISSTVDELKVLETIDLPDKYFTNHKEIVQDFITYRGKDYLLTVVPSKGYREYKVSDNYKNDIFAISLIEVI